MKVILGAFDISWGHESGRAIFDVKKATMHSDWDASSLDFEGDIAILELAREVIFDEFIQPICLIDQSLLNMKEGVVVGWGLINATKIADIPRKLEIPIVNRLRCLKRENSLVNVIWDEAFCAGKDYASVCKGDSGSGFYIEKDGVFYLRGTVSSSVAHDCDGSHFAIYSDIAKYVGFISEVSRQCDLH